MLIEIELITCKNEKYFSTVSRLLPYSNQERCTKTTFTQFNIK